MSEMNGKTIEMVRDDTGVARETHDIVTKHDGCDDVLKGERVGERER